MLTPIPVMQVEPTTGELVGIYPSISKAARLAHVSEAGIKRSASTPGGCVAGGYIWIEASVGRRACPVVQTDPVSGAVVGVWPDIVSGAKAAGTSHGNVWCCVHRSGRYKTAGGYGWRPLLDADGDAELHDVIRRNEPKLIGAAVYYTQADVKMIELRTAERERTGKRLYDRIMEDIRAGKSDKEIHEAYKHMGLQRENIAVYRKIENGTISEGTLEPASDLEGTLPETLKHMMRAHYPHHVVTKV